MNRSPHSTVREAPEAVTAQRRQMLAERFLTDVLRFPWAHAHVESEAMAGAISERVEQRIVELLGDPGTCPHGNPIPGSRNVPDQSSAIALADATGLVEVTRIDDELEEDLDVMLVLEAAGLIPGQLAEVARRDDHGVEVVGSRHDVRIPLAVARLTWVTPVRGPVA